MPEIAQNDQWINAPLQPPSVGTYKVRIRAQDDPIHWKDSNFYNFRKWSDEEVPREYTLNVHRKPIADFTFKVEQNDNYKLTLNPKPSFDPEHQFNRPDKGIIEHTWVSYTVDGVKHDGAPPENLELNKIYDVTLQVQDVDGAYASVTKRISTGDNIKPVALFNVQDAVTRSETLNFVDLSYDPNGDPLTNYEITVRKVGDPTILKTMNTWPKSFSNMGLPEGNYLIGLTVWDIPANPPSLQSDLYERPIKVVNDNLPPKSIFTLTPDPLEEGKLAKYKDSSYDPDNHMPLQYSWKIERIDENGNIEKTFNTGYPPTNFMEFGGIGKYKIYQTVFDSPPAPLVSLSDTSMVELEVVLGKKPPFPNFTWHPETVYETKTFTLDPANSYDIDGIVESFEWTITTPTGNTYTSAENFPKITNAIKGTYHVELHVVDNDGLRSEVPAVHDILVEALPPNIPPVAMFNWDPYEPFLGQDIRFDPAMSYDVDGTIVAWDWKFTSKEGATTTSNQKMPTIPATSGQYIVQLTVTDDMGAKATTSQTVNVQIARLEALVTHTPEWKKIWVKNGYDS